MADWREVIARKLDKTKDKAASALSSIYEQAAKELLGLLLSDTERPMDAVRQGRMLSQILPILARLNTRASMQLSTLLLGAYDQTKREIFRVTLLRAGDRLPPDQFGVGMAFDRINEEKVRITAENSLEYVKSLDQDLKTRIRQEMGIGLVKGETTHEVAKRIARTGLSESYKDEQGIWRSPFHTVQERAKVIARTETARVQAITAQESIRQASGNVPGLMMEWCAAMERSCKYCVALNGQRFRVDDPKAPTIPYHPRCRCVWVSYVPPRS